MAFNATAKNLMLDSLTAVVDFLSLHSGAPGAGGSNELAGGSPAYARKAVTWNAASGSSATGNSLPTFDVEGGDTVAYVGLWDAVTSGAFYGFADVTDEVFGGQGTYQVTAATLSITDS
jgi:hypothetical protein